MVPTPLEPESDANEDIQQGDDAPAAETSQEHHADACEDIYVVGIGASAGGLEALSELMESLPTDVDAAYVVIQHLAPDFESQMPKLLASRTSMPLVHAENDQELEPNKVYFIPSGKNMITSGRTLYLTDRSVDETLVLPIDHFFRSLAQDVGRFAIGVVLTGSGSDGSRGVVDINDAGGLVLVQSPETAGHASMPQQTIKSGAAHLTLSPDSIGDAIGRYIAESLSPKKLAEEEFSHDTSDDVSNIIALLHNRYAIDFSQYKPTTINRRIERRLGLSPQLDLKEYLSRLKVDSEELSHVYKDLLIGVTRFFRDREAFAVLRKRVFPEIVKQSSRSKPIRVWAAGCASGEEAYSLAMLIDQELEAQNKEVPVKIFATDVHPKSLATAGAGIYPQEALEEVPDDLRERYFRPTTEEERFIIHPELRRSVVFAKHDLLSDPPFTRVNLVVCRNMLIYLQPAAQQRCLSLFHFALNTDGILFLGPSETVGDLDDEFAVIDRMWRILRKRRDVKLATSARRAAPTAIPASNLHLPESQSEELPESLSAIAQKPSGDRLNNDSVVQSRMLSRFMPPSFVVDEEFRLLQTFGGGERYLQVRDGHMADQLVDLLPEQLKTFVDGAMHRALRDQTHVSYDRVKLNGASVRVTAEPFISSQHDPRIVVTVQHLANVEGDEGQTNEPIAMANRQVTALQAELRSTRENLSATVEELEAANEELQATNEELSASNEEMQSTNEELQSVNEELHSLNLEHQRKIDELTELTSDMKNLFMATDLGVLFLDRELRIRRSTPVIDEVFNLLPQDVGRHFIDFTHNLDGIDFEKELDAVLKDEQVFEAEVLDRRSNPWLLRMLPYSPTMDTSVEGLVLTLVDVTLLKEQELQLRRYADIIASSEEAILAKDLNGVITHWNRGAENIYGYRADEAVGQHISLIVPQDRRHEIDEIIEAARAGESTQMETIRLNRGGDQLAIRLAVSPIYDSEKNVVGASAVGHDYTQRAHAEEELKIFKRAVDASPVGVIVTDPTQDDNPIVYINSRFEEMTGYSEAESIGHNCRFLQGVGTNSDDIAKIRSAVREEKACRVSLLNYRKDGTPFWNELEVAPIRAAKGKVTHFVGIQHDISIQVGVEQRLDDAKSEAEQANRAKTVFLANMSHDIRTPLTTIIGMAEILHGEESDPRRSEMLDVVVRSGTHLSELIGGILELSKIESGEFQVNREPCSPAQIVEDVVAIMRQQATEKELALHLEIDGDARQHILGDSVRIRQIVFNFVGNALKFTDAGSVSIAMSTISDQAQTDSQETRSSTKSELCISVSDTGRGIESDQLKQAFEPFAQLDDELSTKMRVGTGLGLSISKHLAELMGGRIEGESEIGVGSTFRLLIPMDTTDRDIEPSREKPSATDAEISLNGRQIWAADDERSIRFIVETLLSKAGAIVRTFPDGRDLVDAWREHGESDDQSRPSQRPEIVLVDMEMADLGGIGTAAELRRLGATVPIVALTAGAFEEDRVRCLAAGCNEHLPKPIDSSRLTETIIRLLAERKTNTVAPSDASES